MSYLEKVGKVLKTAIASILAVSAISTAADFEKMDYANANRIPQKINSKCATWDYSWHYGSRINTITVDTSKGCHFDLLTPRNGKGRLMPLSKQVGNYEKYAIINGHKPKVLAAVNGGFFDKYGRPMGTIWRKNSFKLPFAYDLHRSGIGYKDGKLRFFHFQLDKHNYRNKDFEKMQIGPFVNQYGKQKIPLFRSWVESFDFVVTAGPLTNFYDNIALEKAGDEGFSGSGYYGKNPRTAIAELKDGKIMLMTADGRGAGGSKGLTLGEEGDLLKQFGAVKALNLDGGGSTTFLLNGSLNAHNPNGIYLENYPSDGHERWILNGIAVIEN